MSNSQPESEARSRFHPLALLSQCLVVITAIPVAWVLLWPLLKPSNSEHIPILTLRNKPEPVPTGPNMAEKAKKLLRKSKTEPLQGSLELILKEAENQLVLSDAHPLLNRKAPEFSAVRTDSQTWKLYEHLGKKPLILVFYLGYECNHCVSQLFDLQEDLAKFDELGVEIVAISPDSPAHTRERYKTYGPFKFDVLADYEKKVASAYRVFVQPKPDEAGELFHATFVIDKEGIIRWANQDVEPFCGNRTLLYEAAKSLGRVHAITSPQINKE